MISYEPQSILTYESLGVDRLDAYKAFLSDVISADRTIGNTARIGVLEEAHGVSSTNFSMAAWRRRNKRVLLHEACDAYDAMIPSMDPNSEPPIAIDEEVAVGGSMVECAITVVESIGTTVDRGGGRIADGPIAVDGSTVGGSSVAIPIEPSIGIGPNIVTEAISSIIPDIALDAAGAAIASGALPTGPAINRFSRPGHSMAPT